MSHVHLYSDERNIILRKLSFFKFKLKLNSLLFVLQFLFNSSSMSFQVFPGEGSVPHFSRNFLSRRFRRLLLSWASCPAAAHTAGIGSVARRCSIVSSS